MDEQNFDSALVVTSDYYLKCSKLIYDRVNNDGYDLKYIASFGEDGGMI